MGIKITECIVCKRVTKERDAESSWVETLSLVDGCDQCKVVATKFSTVNGYKLIASEMAPVSSHLLEMLVRNWQDYYGVLANTRDLKHGDMVCLGAVDSHNRSRSFYGTITELYKNGTFSLQFNR